MDWNWLFSSLAQSVAALVGVLGAYLVARIIASEGAFASNSQRTRQLLAQAARLTDRAATRYFDWCNRLSLEDELRRLVKDLKTENPLLTPEDYYLGYSFPRYQPKQSVIDEIEGAIESELQHRREAKSRSLIHDLDIVGITHIRPPALDAEIEQIDALVVDVKAHIRDVDQHLSLIKANPERSIVTRVVLAALLLLFLAGVVYPLSFLPVDADGVTIPLLSMSSSELVLTRAAVLAVVLLIFVGLLVGLAILSERLRHSKEDMAALERWLQPGSYSTYLQIRVENGFPL